jgi:hypothetical protein
VVFKAIQNSWEWLLKRMIIIRIAVKIIKLQFGKNFVFIIIGNTFKKEKA